MRIEEIALRLDDLSLEYALPELLTLSEALIEHTDTPESSERIRYTGTTSTNSLIGLTASNGNYTLITP